MQTVVRGDMIIALLTQGTLKDAIMLHRVAIHLQVESEVDVHGLHDRVTVD